MESKPQLWQKTTKHCLRECLEFFRTFPFFRQILFLGERPLVQGGVLSDDVYYKNCIDFK